MWDCRFQALLRWTWSSSSKNGREQRFQTTTLQFCPRNTRVGKKIRTSCTTFMHSGGICVIYLSKSCKKYFCLFRKATLSQQMAQQSLRGLALCMTVCHRTALSPLDWGKRCALSSGHRSQNTEFQKILFLRIYFLHKYINPSGDNIHRARASSVLLY